MSRIDGCSQMTPGGAQRSRRRGVGLRVVAGLLLVLGVGCGGRGDRGSGSGAVSQALATVAYFSDWGSGYCANVTVTNDGTQASTSWTVVMAMNQSTLSTLWSGNYTTSGDQLTVTPASWNAELAVGASTTFGLCANAPGSSNRPTVTSVVFSYPSSGTGGSGTLPTGGTSGTATGGSATGGTGGGTTGGAATGGSTPGESDSISISVPALVNLDQVALAASERLDLADGAQIQSSVNGMPAIVSLGSQGAEIGAGALAGDLYARHSATLRSRAHLMGSLFTAGAITRQDGTIVDGLIVEDYAFEPFNTTSWTVTFPATSAGNIMIEPDQPPYTLSPGRYGNVSVKSRSRLVISAGDYYFEQLHVLEPQSELLIDDTAGPVRLHVREELTTRGKLLGVDDVRPEPLIIVTGTSTLFLESTFSGFLVAPQAEVYLRTTAEHHRGAIFARTIHLDPNVVIEHVPFEHEDFYDDWESAGDYGDLRWGWQGSWEMGDTFPTNPDYGDINSDDTPRHENCDPGLEIVKSLAEDGVTFQTELRSRTEPVQQSCVVEYRECDANGTSSTPSEAELNSSPGADEVCPGSPDRFPCTIDETTIEWDDDLGLCESDADCLLFGKVCAVVCQRVGCTGSPDCIDPTCSSAADAESIEVKRCASPSLESCAATPTETHCQVRNECPEADAVGTPVENPGSRTDPEDGVGFPVQPTDVPTEYLETADPCYDGIVDVGLTPTEEVPRNIASGNEKWGLKIDPSLGYGADIEPSPIAGEAKIDVYAYARLDAGILVWGKEVRVLEAQVRGQLGNCATDFTKTFKVFGFDVDGGGDPVAGYSDTECSDAAPSVTSKYSALGRRVLALTDLLEVEDCYGDFDPNGTEEEVSRWRDLCTQLAINPGPPPVAAPGFEGVDCEDDPQGVVERMVDLYANEIGELSTMLDSLADARQGLANDLLEKQASLEVLDQNHPFSVADIVMNYPVGPVTVSIQIEFGGAWGVSGTLAGEYAVIPDTHVRVEGGLSPYAETTVIVYAGVGVGPVTVGVSGELLIFRLDIPVTAFAEASRTERDDPRKPPSVFEDLGDIPLAFPTKEYDWDMSWGLGAGAVLSMLDGQVNLEARLRLGPFKKSIKKKLADWTGLEKEFVFVSAGTRQGDDDDVEFPSATGSTGLSTVRSEFYFVDAEYLRANGVPWLGDPMACPPPPDLGPCVIVR